MAKSHSIEGVAQKGKETGEIVVSSPLCEPNPPIDEDKKASSEESKPAPKEKIMPEGRRLSSCPNCGAYLAKSDHHFCPNCGADFSAPVNPGCCTKCGSHLPYRLVTFCPTCGKRLRADPEPSKSNKSKADDKDDDSPEEKIRRQGRSIIGRSIFGLIMALLGCSQYFLPADVDLSLLWILSIALAVEAVVVLVLTAIKIKDRRLLLGLAFFFSCTFFITAGGILFLSVFLDIKPFMDMLALANAPIDLFAKIGEQWRIVIAVVFGFIVTIVGLVLFIRSLVLWVKFSRYFKKSKTVEEPVKADDPEI